MLLNLGFSRFQVALRNSFFIFGSGLVVAQAQANLITNGSFEARTDPSAPTSGFSSGAPDNWDDFDGFGGAYLAHENHSTVPDNNARDGEIIVGGNKDIFLQQTFTTVGTGRLKVSWSANNEFTDVEKGTNSISNLFHETAVEFRDTSGTFIDWSGYRASANVGALKWFDHTFTTSAVFEPGDYLVVFFVGGRSSADNLIVSQVPAPATLALLGLGFAGLGYSRRRKT